MFPGGPCCWYKGIKVPAFITFTESGGIDGPTLTEIFRRIDKLKLYEEDRRDGMIPFCLLDGHHSRFDLNFLQYINGPQHKWNVCIGVPYGKAFWQVGDSPEQNGKFKMELTTAKRAIYEKRQRRFQSDLQLLKTDIIPLVNKTWPKAFCDVKANRKAIAERGWFPLNKNLLLNPIIRATMTEGMLKNEIERGIFPLQTRPELHDVEYVVTDWKVSIRQVSTVEDNDPSSYKLNFNKGALAQHCVNTIMSKIDRQNARTRNQQLRDKGLGQREQIMAINRRMTAGQG